MSVTDEAEAALRECGPIEDFWVFRTAEGDARALVYLDHGSPMTLLVEDDAVYEECFRVLESHGRPVLSDVSEVAALADRSEDAVAVAG